MYYLSLQLYFGIIGGLQTISCCPIRIMRNKTQVQPCKRSKRQKDESEEFSTLPLFRNNAGGEPESKGMHTECRKWQDSTNQLK